MRAPKWVQRRFDPAARYGLRVTLFALATLVALGPFLYLLLQVTSEGPLTRTDTEVAESLHSVAEDSPGLVAAAKVVSFLGVPAWFYVIIGAAALYFWRKSRRRIATYLVVTNLVGGVLDTIVKLAVNRPRPELEGPSVEAFGKSFPSGHTMAATVGYGTLLLVFMPLIPRRWRVPAVVTYFVWVTLMGLSIEPFPPKNEIDFQDTSSFWLVRLALGSIRARKNKREMGTHARTASFSQRFPNSVASVDGSTARRSTTWPSAFETILWVTTRMSPGSRPAPDAVIAPAMSEPRSSPGATSGIPSMAMNLTSPPSLTQHPLHTRLIRVQ